MGFGQILISYCKFLISRPLKLGILGDCIIVIFKVIFKNARKYFFVDSPITWWCPKFATRKWPFYNHFCSFFRQQHENILLLKTEVLIVILRCCSCLNYTWIKSLCFPFCKKQKLVNPWKAIFQHFYK